MPILACVYGEGRNMSLTKLVIVKGEDVSFMLHS